MYTKRKNQIQRRKRGGSIISDMDKVFQFYVRLRDAMPGGYTRCISCGKIKPFDQMQGGHFFSRMHYSTRWHEDNVNSECIYDNCWNGDHLLSYRENLIKKIGLARFKNLEVLHNQTRKWSDFEVLALIKHYGQQILQLSSSKHIPISTEVQRIIKKHSREKK